MSESIPPAGGGATSAGAMLRQARQAQGMHIAALAAAIKVTPRKLELLESDQFDQLPDATFTRALAQTVCRALKIDATPVLALLPQASGHQRLEHVGSGLNTPFRDRPNHMAPQEWGLLGNPVFWLVGVIVLAAAALYVLPASWLHLPSRSSLRIGAASAPAAGEAASAVVTEPLMPPPEAVVPNAGSPSADAAPTGAAAASAPAAGGAGDATGAANVAANAAKAETPAAPVSGVLQLLPSGQSWVEVTDARGKVLISRLIEPGEAVGLDGTPPFKLKVGNADTTQVVYRGRPVELAPYVRDNVARFELK